MGVEPKIGVEQFTPKMDGENFMENSMNKWMIWGGFPPLFLVQHPYIPRDSRQLKEWFRWFGGILLAQPAFQAMYHFISGYTAKACENFGPGEGGSFLVGN